MAESMTLRDRWDVAAPWATTVVRIALSAILGYAGLIKISDTAAAVRSVRAYEILPEGLVQVWAFGQPFLEIAIALLLLVGLASRLTAVAAAVLLVVFIAGIVSVWVRGLSIDCGCFGGGGKVDPGQTQYPRKIAEDVGFLALAVWIAAFPDSRFSLDRYLLGDVTGGADGDDDDGGDDGDDGDDGDGDAASAVPEAQSVGAQGARVTGAASAATETERMLDG